MAVSLVLDVQVGATTPQAVSAEFIDALAEVEVVRVDEPFCGFQLKFESDYAVAGEDHPLLASGELDPFNRVIVTMEVDGTPVVLMDGFITSREVVVNPGGGSTSLYVKGMDACIKMYMAEVSMGYEGMNDAAIAAQIIGRYSSIGVTADARTPSVEVTPERYVPQQVTDDLSYLTWLAERNGHLFYVKPETGSKSTAYWGPKELDLEEQEPLTGPDAPLANVTNLKQHQDALALTGHYGQRLGTGADNGTTASAFSAVTYGAATTMADDEPPLGEIATLADDASGLSGQVQALEAQLRLLDLPFLGTGMAGQAAGSRSDRSISEAVQVTGDLDTLEYEAVLEAPGVVLVRGTGNAFDGLYYVKQVVHKISLGEDTPSHTQQFTLVREWTGSTR